jgi:hypothetical protein
MSPADFSAWLERVRVLHGWDQKAALAQLGAGKNQGARWRDPNGSGAPEHIGLACAALARRVPLKPWTPASR